VAREYARQLTERGFEHRVYLDADPYDRLSARASPAAPAPQQPFPSSATVARAGVDRGAPRGREDLVEHDAHAARVFHETSASFASASSRLPQGLGVHDDVAQPGDPVEPAVVAPVICSFAYAVMAFG
jgi:hypothetical protein